MPEQVIIGYAPVKMLRWEEDIRAQLEALQIEWGTDCQYMIIRQESFP